jgi:predicted O-linked N-acetylglucosamine transferase (SPINDLY family)
MTKELPLAAHPEPLPANWQQQADRLIQQNNYSQAAKLYEQAIELEPEVKTHYWQLGVLMLLQGQEAEAQTIWLMAMTMAEPDQVEPWTLELVQILENEAIRCEAIAEYSTAWMIRQHIREIHPAEVNNLLRLVSLWIQQETMTVDDLIALEVIPLLHTCDVGEVKFDLLMQTLTQVLHSFSPHDLTLEFAIACLKFVNDLPTFMAVLLPAAVRIAYEAKAPKLAASLLEQYCLLEPHNIEILGHLSIFYQNASLYEQGIETARLRLALADSLAEKIFSSHVLLRGLMSAGGYWQQASTAVEQHRQLLRSLVAENPTDLHPVHTVRLCTASYFLPYFSDSFVNNRLLQNQVMALSHSLIQQQDRAKIDRFRLQRRPPSVTPKPIKIGYLSNCMKQHSVGWLARWLIKYHDRSRFQLHGYFIGDRLNDGLYNWYVNQMDHAHITGVDHANDSDQIAERIHQDAIDILIDLDSLTVDLSCHILALKPAPVQVTWLGWDATGIPGVDYFIADPYVLPDNAQDYYTETIWRLPQTYIAVDGFEVEVPSLRRDRLDIPSDAVIFLSAQKGYKRHADTARWQMQIIKNVPNSYFLIKGSAEQESIQQFFVDIARSEGVDPDRLRFLPETTTEGVHRADLAIADVVLDTYPYNGATTTLETLWMGIPIVTRVGQQFAARNSYTMLKNVGVEEGIAWTDEDYVEWGVRLGTDASLRQQVREKMRRSRQTAPLWNAEKFTREMEHAYEQMWKKYI